MGSLISKIYLFYQRNMAHFILLNKLKNQDEMTLAINFINIT
ncbi:MAG: hypothetical protein ACJASL_000476 [Paraglaciecola sp.]|jgi:hypothetical protein